MKKIKRIMCLVFFTAGISALYYSQEQTSSEYTGPYFGQNPPGNIAVLFAPGFISTEGYDITPTFSPKLDEVFFGRRPTEEGSDNKIFYSKMINNRWLSPVPAPFSSGAIGFEAQFSYDGDTVLFNRGKYLYTSQRSKTGWGDAVIHPIPVREGMCAAIAENGNLYFTAARSKEYGIFKSVLENNEYQTPTLAIPMAAHPFVAPDESYLLFDKYSFRDGAQTSKLFVSFMLQDGQWSDPIELDEEINKTGTELIPKVSPDGKYLFFQRKVEGNTDIYWIDARIIEE